MVSRRHEIKINRNRVEGGLMEVRGWRELRRRAGTTSSLKKNKSGKLRAGFYAVRNFEDPPRGNHDIPSFLREHSHSANPSNTHTHTHTSLTHSHPSPSPSFPPSP